MPNKDVNVAPGIECSGGVSFCSRILLLVTKSFRMVCCFLAHLRACIASFRRNRALKLPGVLVRASQPREAAEEGD
jgi:hypothetical protein